MQIDISNLQKYNCKIFTDSGFENVIDNFIKEEECLELHFSNWEILKVAKNHLFELLNNVWIYASDLKIGTKIISENNIVSVVNIIDIGNHRVYDLTVDSEKHQYYANNISSHNSGKTLLAISAGIGMVKKGEYDKIIYIRNSVESVDKAEEVGFLPGFESKFEIYNYPLYDTLEFIVQFDLKKKEKEHKDNKDQKFKNENNNRQEFIQNEIIELQKRYNIDVIWPGAIRGRTISNAFVIIDEVQNFGKKSLQTVLSRMDKDCKVICIGSNRQIDHPYINKYTNGLSTLIKVAKEENNEVNIFGTELNKVVRGKITEWAERIFEKK